MSPRLSRVLPVLLVAWAACATFAPPAPAATPCWKLLLNDWYDGAISNIYPIPCYHQAIKHLPTDVQVYSSARDDIKQALSQRIVQNARKRTSARSLSH